MKTDHFHIARRGTGDVTEFPINSYVLVNYENEQNRPPTKLHTHLRGPLQVVNFVGPIYTLRNLVTNKLEDFHVKLLRAFHYDIAEVDPANIAMHDNDYFVIEHVQAHRFNGPKSKKSSLEFQIKWDNQLEPTWHQWSNDLGNNSKIHAYLKENQMKRFIPTKYTWPKSDPRYYED